MSDGAGAARAAAQRAARTELARQLRSSVAGLPARLALVPASGESARARVVRPPGSKSLTNRALLLSALAQGTSTLRGALVDGDDALVMVRALRTLGAKVERTPGGLRVRGVGGRWKPVKKNPRLDLHNAGTATRFLAAAALLAPCPVVIDGDARMRQRPIGELGDALARLGAGVEYLGRKGCPPVRISPPHSTARCGGGAVITMGRTASSQFISALLLVAARLQGGLRLELTEGLTSAPYVAMTIGVLRAWGVGVSRRGRGEGTRQVTVRPALVRGRSFRIESDASGACPLLAAGALLAGRRVRVVGFDAGPRAAQGDAHFHRVLRAMGARTRVGRGFVEVVGTGTLRPLTWDFRDMPDTAMTAAVLCAFARPTRAHASATSVLRGLRTLRVKETDRVAALATELRRLGAMVGIEDGGDVLRITPGPDGGAGARRVVLRTYRDHRMAMSLALAGLVRPGVVIDDPGCVAKTYPTFWKDWAGFYDR